MTRPQPFHDDVAIVRRMHGEKNVWLTKEEKAELVHRWLRTGRSLREMERITGVNKGRYRDLLQEAS